MTPIVVDCTRRKKVCPYSTPELQPCSRIGNLQPNPRTGIQAHPNLHRPTPPARSPLKGGAGGVGLGWGQPGSAQTDKHGMGIPGIANGSGYPDAELALS